MASKNFDDPYRIDLDRSVADIFSEYHQSQLDSRGLRSWEEMNEQEREQFTDIDDFQQERMDVWHEMTAGVPAHVQDWINQVRKDVESRRHPTVNRIIDGLTQNYIKAAFVTVEPSVTIGLEVLDRVQDAAQWVKMKIVEFLGYLEDTMYNRINDELFMKGNIGTATFTSDTVQLKEIVIDEGRAFFEDELRRVKRELEEKGGEVKDKISRVCDYFVSAVIYLLQDEIEVLENMYGR